MSEVAWDEKIENVLKHFRADHVHIMMRAVGWQWVGVTSSDGIPSVREIENCARYLLEKVVDTVNGPFFMPDDKTCAHATGGLYAGYDDGDLFIRFDAVEACEEGPYRFIK